MKTIAFRSFAEGDQLLAGLRAEFDTVWMSMKLANTQGDRPGSQLMAEATLGNFLDRIDLYVCAIGMKHG